MDKNRSNSQITNYIHVCTEPRLNLNIDGMVGVSNIIAILAPQMQGPCTFGINLHISYSKYDKF